jgi:hypothetical protein
MTYQDILNGSYKLVFKHAVSKPTTTPDLVINGLNLWVVDDGIICIAPRRSFPFGNSHFVFKYPVSGNAYLCPFNEIQPAQFRTPRNSGTVQISTNKNPVPLKPAIGIIWKELNKAVKYYQRITPQTKVYGGYATNSVIAKAGGIKPAYWYANTIYVLYVDYKALKASYKPLISQDHIMKLYYFVENQPKEGWEKAFGFTQIEFLNLMENCTK